VFLDGGHCLETLLPTTGSSATECCHWPDGGERLFPTHSSHRPRRIRCPKLDVRADWCVFRIIVTGRFGIVTAEFGNVTGHSGDVTDGL
jgi:hypothetical protein